MKSTIKIYIGRPVSSAEAKAVKRLHSQLSQRNVEAVLLANFTAKSRQIDCVMITPLRATLLDFKEISGPVCGGLNGRWLIRSHGGVETPYPGENPYMEVSTAKYALSDEMAKFQRTTNGVPNPLRKRFYSEFDAAVCLCPDIMPGSNLPAGDFKCWIWGLPEAIETACTHKIESSWSLQHWELFATEYLGLEAVSLGAATDGNYRSAEQALSEYSVAFSSLLGHNLPPPLAGLCTEIPPNDHFLVIGQSGIGKTTRLHHYALESLRRETFVLFAEAMHYSGDFRALLRKSVAPFSARDIELLLGACSTCGYRMLVILDAFDRCKEHLRPSLIRDIIAFQRRYDCQIAVTSQFDPEVPAAIKCHLFQVGSLSPDQKRAVFRFHADDSEVSDPSLLAPFDTAHDVMVAASCRSQSPESATRSDVYDSYILQCLPANHSALAGALCRDLASTLSRDFTGTMSRQDFERHAENFVRKHGGSIDVVDALRQSRLLKVSLPSFSFSHDLIQEHLYADWLYRTAPDLETLCSELRKPGHRQLAYMAVSRSRSTEDAKALLRAAGSVSLMEQIFRGYCGSTARTALLQDCYTFLTDAATDLPNIALSLKIDREKTPSVIFSSGNLTGFRAWSAYEMALASFIGKNVDTSEFAEPVGELVALSGASLHESTTQEARGVGFSPRLAFDQLLHECLLLEDKLMTLPAITIFKVWSRVYRDWDAEGKPWAVALWSRADALSPGARAFILFALCELHEWNRPASTNALQNIFRRAWDSRLHTLRAKALQMLTNAARGDAPTSLKESPAIRDLLSEAAESMGHTTILFNMFLMDAMNAYGMIEPPVRVSNALLQVRGLLDPRSDYAREVVEMDNEAYPQGSRNPLAEDAYRILGLCFEEIYQGVYWEAFQGLSEPEQTAFMNLAAQAEDPSFHIGYILAGLVRVSSSTSLPVFQRFASHVNVKSSSSQDAVQGFLLAIIGCAQLGAQLPRWEMEKTVATEAWRIIRELVYIHFAGASTPANVDDLWLTLWAEAGLGIADALWAIRNCYVFEWGGTALKVDLPKSYPSQVKLAMEHSLSNLTKLTSAWDYRIWPEDNLQRSTFVIDTLGAVGDQNTQPLLKGFTRDPLLGEAAIAALKQINARV